SLSLSHLSLWLHSANCPVSPSQNHGLNDRQADSIPDHGLPPLLEYQHPQLGWHKGRTQRRPRPPSPNSVRPRSSRHKWGCDSTTPASLGRINQSRRVGESGPFLSSRTTLIAWSLLGPHPAGDLWDLWLPFGF
ncbi:hypothetical protein CLAIMM_05862 isoform 2, partial [Cladophialophora immunda]